MDAKEVIGGMVGALEAIHKKINYVKCPICNEEWTKLMPVQFFVQGSDGKPKHRQAYCCPPCAKSVHSAPWFAKMFSIIFDHGYKICRFPAFAHIEPHMVKPDHVYMEYPTRTKVVPRGDRVEVHQEGRDMRSFPNIAAAISFLATGDAIPPKEGSKWGEIDKNPANPGGGPELEIL